MVGAIGTRVGVTNSSPGSDISTVVGGRRRPGHFTTVNDPHAPPVSTFVGAINSSGLITGGYLDIHGMFHGFLDRRGVFTTFNDPAGAQGTAGEALSNTGVIVGFYTDTHGSNHGCAFTPAR